MYVYNATLNATPLATPNATPNTTPPTTPLATPLNTDPFGAGSIVYSTNPQPGEFQLPAGVIIEVGTTISVGDLEGTFVLI